MKNFLIFWASLRSVDATLLARVISLWVVVLFVVVLSLSLSPVKNFKRQNYEKLFLHSSSFFFLLFVVVVVVAVEQSRKKWLPIR